MMRFVIYGRFEAESIDDAFQRLALHFGDLADGVSFVTLNSAATPAMGICELEIRPADPGGVTMLRHDA